MGMPNENESKYKWEQKSTGNQKNPLVIRFAEEPLLEFFTFFSYFSKKKNSKSFSTVTFISHELPHLSLSFYILL